VSDEVAELRLRLAEVLVGSDRADDAVIEAQAALAESTTAELRASCHHLLGRLLAKRLRLLDAVGEWITALQLAPDVRADSAVAAARVFDGPRSEALARQLDTEQLDVLRAVVERRGRCVAADLLLARVCRLRGEPQSFLQDAPPAADLDDGLRVLLAEEYAAAGLVAEGLAAVNTQPAVRTPAGSALRARLLLRLGRTFDIITLPTLAELPMEDSAAQSMAATRALALLGRGDRARAESLLEPYRQRNEVEPRLAAVVLALDAGDEALAKSVLVGLESLSGRSDDIRLLRAQLHLELGDAKDLRRGRDQLRRLAESSSAAGGRRAPLWLELQAVVRADNPRFEFVQAVWAALVGEPQADALLDRVQTGFGLTAAQLAVAHEEWSARLQDRSSAEAAAHLARAATHWMTAGVTDIAVDVAQHAVDLDPQYGAELSDALVRDGRAILAAGSDAADIDSAIERARRAWGYSPSAEGAELWCEAVMRRHLDQSGSEVERDVREVEERITELPATPTLASYRGWVHARLADVAARNRLDENLRASEWLLAAALNSPTDPFHWSLLTWSFTALGSHGLALAAAENARRLAGDDGSPLRGEIAARLSRGGTDDLIPRLLSQLEKIDPTMSGWVNGIRLILATVSHRFNELPAYLAKIDESMGWLVESAAEAELLTCDVPNAATSPSRSVELNKAAGLSGSAARMELFRGHLAEARTLVDKASDERIERLRGIRLTDLQLKLVEGDPTAEAAWQAQIEASTQLGDLQFESAVDLRILQRGVPTGSGPAAALDRLGQAYRDRCAELTAEQPVLPGGELRELTSPTLSGLAGLWLAEERGADWAEIAALADTAEGAAPGSPVQPIVVAAAAAVRDRVADRLLAALTPQPDLDGDAASTTGLEGIEEWVDALIDPHRTAEARALHTLHLLLTCSSTLGEALAAAGLDADTSLDGLVGHWTSRIPDVDSGWRFFDLLKSRLPADTWPLVSAALLDQLSELSGLRFAVNVDSRSPQTVDLGRSLIPADPTGSWSIFKTHIPAIREAIASRSGVDLPGFRLRPDRDLDGSLTYALNDRIVEFADGMWPAGDDSEEETNELVARLLREWSEAHLADLYLPYHIGDTARTRPQLAPALDRPTAIVAWLDLARDAIRQQRRVDADEFAAAIAGPQPDQQQVLTNQRADLVIAGLEPWPAEEVVDR
jgi:tetratricopeptide (TPR) repeat protein